MPVLRWVKVRSVFCAVLVMALVVGLTHVLSMGPAGTVDVPSSDDVAVGWPGTIKEVAEPESLERQVHFENTGMGEISERDFVIADSNEDYKDDRDTGGIGGPDIGVRYHRVSAGETLSQISSRFDVGIQTLVEVNDLANPHMINVGDELTIPPSDGIFHRVSSGDSLWAIGRKYDVSIDRLMRENSLDKSSIIRPGQLIFVPGASSSGRSTTAVAASTTTGGSSIQFSWPLETKGRISSPYGPRSSGFHYGLDIAVPYGTRVLAAAEGRIASARWKGSYGLMVRIEHGNGYETVYAHASQINVYEGQDVSRGDTIAHVGSTGRSTGPHLHFEVRVNETPKDPASYLP